MWDGDSAFLLNEYGSNLRSEPTVWDFLFFPVEEFYCLYLVLSSGSLFVSYSDQSVLAVFIDVSLTLRIVFQTILPHLTPKSGSVYAKYFRRQALVSSHFL